MIAQRLDDLAMHMNEVRRPRPLVQRVDILRDRQHLAGIVGLQPRQRRMRRIGFDVARIVAPAVVEIEHTLRIAHISLWRRHILKTHLRPDTILIAKRGKAGFR